MSDAYRFLPSTVFLLIKQNLHALQYLMYRARPGGRLHKISSGIKKRKSSLNSALEILRQNKRDAFSCLASFQSKAEHQGLFTSQLRPSSTFDAIISGEGKQERIPNPTSLFLYPSEPRRVQETNRSERKERKKMNYPTVAIYHAQRHGREREEKKKRKGLIDIDHYLASLHFQIKKKKQTFPRWR